MKEIRIKISRKTKQVFLPDDFLIVNGENLQSKLVFEFTDEFVNGQARIEYEADYQKYYQWLTKEDNTYTIPLKSTLTGASHIDLNLVVTEGTNVEEIPKFVSKMFYFNIDPAVNATIEQPDKYPEWIEIANAKLNSMDEALEEVDNLNITAERVEDGVEISITDKQGETTTRKVNDGEKGEPGDDYIITEEDYEAIADIVEENIIIPGKVSDLENDLGFITNTVNNLVNYYKKTETYSKDEIDYKISQISGARLEKVNVLPEEGEEGVIYLVPNSTHEERNIFDEYIWIDNDWELIGSTEINLSNYYTKSETDLKLDNKTDKIKNVNSGYSICKIDNKNIYLQPTQGTDLYTNPNNYIGLKISTKENKDIATVTDVINLDGTITRNLKFTLEENNYQGIRIYVGNYSDYTDVIFRGWLPKLYNVDNPNTNLIQPITSSTMTTSWNYNKKWNIRGSMKHELIDSTNYAVYNQSGDSWKYACYGDENLTLPAGTYIFSMNYSSTGGHDPSFYFSLGINGSYSKYTDVIDYIIDGTAGDTIITTNIATELSKGNVIYFLDNLGNTMQLSENVIEGTNNSVFGNSSHAEGDGVIVNGKFSHGEGRGNNFEVTGVSTSYTNNVSKMIVSGARIGEIRKNAVIWCNGYYYVESYTASGNNVELTLNKEVTNFTAGELIKVFMGSALASASHIEGNFNNTVYLDSETLYNEDNVNRSHAEGSRTLAGGYASHTEGEYTQAIGNMTHAEGRGTTALGNHSHTEGRDTIAYGSNTHVEGRLSTAYGSEAHAEGFDTHANGDYSHTSGYGTRTSNEYQFAIGSYNNDDWENLFEVGNGTGNDNRSNAFAVKKNGSAEVKTQGIFNTAVVQKKYVDDNLANKVDDVRVNGTSVVNDGVANIPLADYLPKSGGTMTGRLVVGPGGNGKIKTGLGGGTFFEGEYSRNILGWDYSYSSGATSPALKINDTANNINLITKDGIDGVLVNGTALSTIIDDAITTAIGDIETALEGI